ncbi:MAG: rhodanese-like domain-containing protein [Proteobacteria bacterium]|nr:rhodanese-like domain-containing protein [Pseudomonadota bacterium]
MTIATRGIFFTVAMLLIYSLAFAGVEPAGIDSKEAYKMVMENPKDAFIVDVRTRAEYEFVGHPDLPNGVPNIPLKFYPGWKVNANFVKNAEERYSKDVTLIMLCRSGGRAKVAAKLLLDAGFKKVLYMTDSFEGSKDEKGHRTVSGWKVNGLPYTYRLDKELLYK